MTATWPTVRLTVAHDQLELASADLWDLGTTGIAELDEPFEGVTLLVAGFPSVKMAATAAAALDGAWDAFVDVVVGDDWLDAWREHFEPFHEGRIVVTPAWKATEQQLETNADDVRIDLDPGRVFGTGAHPSTALVLDALQSLIHGGERVLDVGCGSGVLSLAAVLLGAGSAVCTDIDDDAVGVTTSNADRNHVRDRIMVSTTPVEAIEGSFDIVVANILAPVLIEFAPSIAARVGACGSLVLSGLIAGQADRVVSAYPHFSVAKRTERGRWICLTLSRD